MNQKNEISQLIGLQFGKLTVSGEADRRVYANGVSYFQVRCSCACGGEKVVRIDKLRDGFVTTCGCGRKGVTRDRPKGSDLPEYRSWVMMKNRCRRTKGASYEAYMKRGIKVCAEWEESFQAFFEHVGPKPTPSHTLDRVNNDLGYQPGNVRWATMKEQASNRRWPRKRKGYQPEQREIA